MAELDTSTIYMQFTCPICKMQNNHNIGDVGFGFEIDLDVDDMGACRPWLEVQCQWCSSEFEKNLNILTEETE